MQFILNLLKKFTPEKNIICAYIGGAACAALVHFLVAANVNLDATQAASLAAFTTGAIAHIWDTVVKYLQGGQPPVVIPAPKV